ncbi:MAG: aminomethyl-transferring glycine dehydrogenase subunit GcvPB [Candidatus Cloacimonetes bacterium]|nr:aminomethyl-transferring glycine dehydrogenase subunit GcvPB [Candidatus Cloacimonadota bacterium]
MAKTIFEKHSPGRKGYTLPANDVQIGLDRCFPKDYLRQNELRLPEVSELDVMRHFIELSHLNHFIEKGFYPLGSCTMKYNPKISETLVRNDGFLNLHPNQDEDTVQGALQLLYELQRDLAEISGFDQVTLQPVAGAHGEFTGLKIIRAYHEAKGNFHKKKIILPDSAHGTNPASVILTGYEVVEIKSNARGMVDLEALKAAVDDETAGFMLTNPNTLGLFETQIEEIAEVIHGVDGLMYMDGANFNALLGIVKPGEIGFDIMHYNLHKTFATPHGGGGPGSGPIGVRHDLAKFLPVPMIGKNADRYFLDFGHEQTSIGKIHSFFGNFLVNVRAYIYIKMVGPKGLKRISENAILNANYLMKKLNESYYIPHRDIFCMHEFVASGKWQKEKYDVKTLDIAKRLLDKGHHAPTIYFPLIIPEAMMIEPTETESRETLDEFIRSMLEIAGEAESDPDKLFNAPFSTPVRRVDDTRAVRELNVKTELPG